MKKRPAGAAAAPAKRRAVAAPAPKIAAEPGPEPGPAFEFTRCHSLVPEQVRELYEKVLPMVFAVPKEKRHRFEERVASEALAVLAGVREDIERKMQEASAATEAAGGDEAQCMKSLEEQRLLVEGLTEAFKAKTRALAEVALAYRGCREAVKEAKLSAEEGAKEVEQATCKRVELEAYMEEFKALKAGTFESPEVLKASLPAMLKKFSLTDTLVQAAPTALLKEPSERGEFDTSVVNHVEEELLTRLASYESTIKDAEPAAAALGEKTKAAVAALAEAAEVQLKAADEMTEARASVTAADEKVAALQLSHEAIGENVQELKSTFESLKAKLEEIQKDEDALAAKAAAEGPEAEEAAKAPEPMALESTAAEGEAQAAAPAVAESEGV